MSKFEIEDLLNSLRADRKVFHSEADFQHALAWQIRLKYDPAKIRLEVPFALDKVKVHLDLLVVKPDAKIGIELKYKKSPIQTVDNGESFDLTKSGASSHARYDYFKDIERLQNMIKAGKITKGYAIFLTNDQSYWVKPRETDNEPGYSEFKMHDDHTSKVGYKNWINDLDEKKANESRKSPIFFNKDYYFKWAEYSQIKTKDAKDGTFKYLLVKVTPQ